MILLLNFTADFILAIYFLNGVPSSLFDHHRIQTSVKKKSHVVCSEQMVYLNVLFYNLRPPTIMLLN